jgi:hypothetical protein
MAPVLMNFLLVSNLCDTVTYCKCIINCYKFYKDLNVMFNVPMLVITELTVEHLKSERVRKLSYMGQTKRL